MLSRITGSFRLQMLGSAGSKSMEVVVNCAATDLSCVGV
jgi:hypothetical protein